MTDSFSLETVAPSERCRRFLLFDVIGRAVFVFTIQNKSPQFCHQKGSARLIWLMTTVSANVRNQMKHQSLQELHKCQRKRSIAFIVLGTLFYWLFITFKGNTDDALLVLNFKRFQGLLMFGFRTLCHGCLFCQMYSNLLVRKGQCPQETRRAFFKDHQYSLLSPKEFSNGDFCHL